MKWIAIGVSALVIALVLTVSRPAPPLHAQASGTAPRPADVESFRKTIEPIFMKDRGGTMAGYAACVMCHTWQTSLRFDLETPATDSGWTAAQSRTNFEMITQLINTRSPELSYQIGRASCRERV